MSFVDIDLTKADVIPVGSYVATITKAEIKQPKDSSKSPYINWQFFVPEAGMSVFHITSLKASFAVKKVVEAAGVEFSASGFELDECIGKQIQVDISIEEDPNYGTRNTVSKVGKA